MKLSIRDENILFADDLEIERVKKGGITIVGTRKKGRGAPARNYSDAKGVIRGTINAPRQEAVKASKGVKGQKALWYRCMLWLDLEDGTNPIEVGLKTMSANNDVLLDGKTLSSLMPKKGKAKGGKKKAA